MPKVTPTREAYKLLNDGSIALSRVEEAGMRIDEDLLDQKWKKIERKISKLTTKLQEDKLFKPWKKMFQDKANLGSRPQLAKVLIAEGLLKQITVKEIQTSKGNKKHNIKMDEDALSKIDHPFVRDYVHLEKLKKAKGTYLTGIKREIVNGYIHPIFNLHIPTTYRGSAEMPNAQNIPRRVEEMARLVRECFIPRKNHVLIEMDFKGVEVTVSACYHKDPVMIEYILDKSKDMHRDMAAECYACRVKDVTKPMRDMAKNQFVFPEFYGSYFQQCAPDLWESILRFNLQLADGTLVGDHLESKGIHERGSCSPDERPKQGTFEYHLKQVEEKFWGKRFKAYAAWKEKWWQDYVKKGYVQYYTGFIVSGLNKRNEILNYPIQGAAFHCLLWCLIKMVKWLIKHKMKSVVIAQIHDSMLLDVHKKELEDVLAHAKYLMTEAIMKHWPWLIVPLEVESEIGEKNWYDKRAIEL